MTSDTFVAISVPNQIRGHAGSAAGAAHHPVQVGEIGRGVFGAQDRKRTNGQYWSRTSDLLLVRQAL